MRPYGSYKMAEGTGRVRFFVVFLHQPHFSLISGGELFEKRRKRAEKWVVDESHHESKVPPNQVADKFSQQQALQQEQVKVSMEFPVVVLDLVLFLESTSAVRLRYRTRWDFEKQPSKLFKFGLDLVVIIKI